ncbi:hypothetical protein AB1Y20_001232 [Prymnesium parvum]|uniref:ubiquitinyl hydrolase 1 n=1 Tax=Prymnesium parvum TaxID=97485 RepID=A0AB34KB11_PRYPA
MAIWDSPVFRDIILGTSLASDPRAPPAGRCSLQALTMSVELVMRQLESLRKSPELGTAVRNVAERVHASFSRSTDVCRAMPVSSEAAPMYNLVALIVGRLRQLSPREAILVPAGFKDGRLLYVVHYSGLRNGVDSFDVAVCSTGDGIQYHPMRLDPTSGAVQYNSPLVLRDIPANRVRNGAFWYTALRAVVMTDGRCTAATVYEQLLPFLNQKPLLANCPKLEPSETPSVGSGIEPLWLTPNEGGGDAFGHQLATLAATVALQLSAEGEPGLEACNYNGAGLSLLLRHQLIVLTMKDLQMGVPQTHSTLELIQRTSKRCSASSAMLASGASSLTASDLAAMQRDLDAIEGLVKTAKRTFTTEASAVQPPAVREIRGDTRYPFFDRLSNYHSVEELAGKVLERPIVLPVDLSLVPDNVQTVLGASNAMQHAVYACTLLSNQRGLVRDSYALRISLVAHLFLRVLPPPLPRNDASRCFWASAGATITSDTQGAILKWIGLLCRQYVAASLSVPIDRSFDAMRMLTLAAMAAIADAVLRCKAHDAPSALSLQYSGRAEGTPGGFALEMRHFERESERGQLLQPHLAATRTALLDYFRSTAADVPEKHLLFRYEHSMALSYADRLLVRQLALQLGFPRDDTSLAHALSGEESAMTDLFPELATIRDVAFYLKASMVPSLDALPELRGWSPEDAKLTWKWKDGKFVVRGFGGILHCGGWLDAPESVDGEESTPDGTDGRSSKGDGARRLPKLGIPKMAALHRLLGRPPKPRLPPSAADPSNLVGTVLESEDDVLHIRHLPDFHGNLRPADCEVLLQCLLHPYIRIPLVLRFFAEPSRTAVLACASLQEVLDAALFEPGAWHPDVAKTMPSKIPSPNRSHLATPTGLLFQELTHSPAVILDSINTILENAIEADVGRYSGSGSAVVILYTTRLALRIEAYARYLLSPHADKVRGLALPADGHARTTLEHGTAALRTKFEHQLMPILLGWYSRLRRDAQTRDAAVVSTHLAFVFGGLTDGGMHFDERSLFILLSSRVFINVHHDFNIEPDLELAGQHRSRKRRASGNENVHESRLGYEALDVFDLWQSHLVKIVNALHGSPADSHTILDGVVKLLSGAQDVPSRQWRELPAMGCCGRFVPGSAADVQFDGGPSSDYETWLRANVSSISETEVNVQLGQLTLNQHQMQLLDKSVSEHPDFVAVFGSRSSRARHQCGEVSRTEHRQWFRLLAVDHDVQIWDVDDIGPPLPPRNAKGSSLGGWVTKIVEPVFSVFDSMRTAKLKTIHEDETRALLPLVQGVSQEVWVPEYLLNGLLPQALLDTYQFWQRPDGNLLVYSVSNAAVRRLLQLFEQMEDIGHILMWSTEHGDAECAPDTEASLELLELPRLRLSFKVQRGGDGVANLHSIEHHGLKVSWLRSERAAALLRGLPHALLLENAEGDTLLLLSALSKPFRVSDVADPLSAQLLLARHSTEWTDALSSVRHYLYAVHRSGSFLTPPSLAARIYLLILRWLARDYEGAFSMAKSCASDTHLTAEEAQLWALLADFEDDVEPGAHSLRLQLWLATRCCPELQCPWNVGEQLQLYLFKLPFITASLRLAAADEMQLLGLHSNLPQASSRFAYLTTALNDAENERSLRASYPSRPKYRDYDMVLEYRYVLHTAPSWQKKMSSLPYTRPDLEKDTSGPLALARLNGWLNSGLKLDADGGRGFWFQYELLTGSAVFKLLPEDDPHVLGCLLSRLSASGGLLSTSDELVPLLVLLEAEPELAQELPRFQGSAGGLSVEQYFHRRKGALGMVGGTLGLFKGKAGKGFPEEICHALQKLIPQLTRQAKVQLLCYSEPELLKLAPRQAHGSWLRPRNYGCGLELRWMPSPFNEEVGSESLVLQTLKPTEFIEVTSNETSSSTPPAELAVEKHPASKSVVARKMLRRLREDAQWFSEQMDQSGFAPPTLVNFSQSGDSASKLKLVERLVSLLEELSSRDAATIEAWTTQLLQTAAEGGSSAAENDRRARHLAMRAGFEPKVTLELLAELLMSAKGEAELRVINPLLTEDEAYDVLQQTSALLLVVNRDAHAARALSLARRLDVELRAERTADAEAATYDPRLLVFEFSTGFVLRAQQVHLLRKLVATTMAGGSLCHQMLMGEGKTTVVCPLLALLLGDAALVLQVVPAPLLKFALSVLRGVFGSGALNKAVWTFSFDRRTAMTQELLLKYQSAVDDHAVVLSTPTAVKAFMLKFVELLHLLDTGQYPRERKLASRAIRKVGKVLRMRRTASFNGAIPGALDKKALHSQTTWAVALLAVFRKAVAVIDEVDMVLHPLRSELNWPLGDKYPLDFAPTRWELVDILLDAMVSVQFDGTDEVRAVQQHTPPGKDTEVMRALRAAVDVGLQQKKLQKVPHLVLLSQEFYQDQLRPVLAEWLLIWYRRQGLRDVTDEQLLHCLSTKGADASVEAILPDRQVKLINLGFDWLSSLLPHVLSKVNRVHYGLLRPHELEYMAANGTLPRTRRFLAVPFVGKDAPSLSSEYAHPDVAIGLTTLAYRYEGLRKVDFGATLQQLRTSLESEAGPEMKRPSSQAWISWVHSVPSKRVRGTAGSRGTSNSNSVPLQKSTNEPAYTSTNEEMVRSVVTAVIDAGGGGNQHDILPLHLLDLGDVEYMELLYRMLRQTPLVVRYYLHSIVLPDNTAHQASKLSANGQDLGGHMLFSRSIGFSGTPSSLLPLELGECVYQRGDDARMLKALTDPSVVSRHYLDGEWSVHSLLQAVTDLKPTPHALIDAGALVTGMSNQEVAEHLIRLLDPTAFEGVVFLEQGGHKKILLRTGAKMDLERCGIQKERRFSFFDQVHTTGMDIPQGAAARAVLTLGADLIFRDFAQAAFRMRGIGKGQRIILFVIPEVERLKSNEAARGRGCSASERSLQVSAMTDSLADRAHLEDITCWLLINSFKTERVQFELWTLHCAQNVWRKRAFSQLLVAYKEVGEWKADQGSEDQWLTRHCLSVFREPVNHDLSNSVPQRDSTKDIITSAASAQAKLIVDQGDHGSINHVLALLAGHDPSQQEGMPKEEATFAMAQATAFGEEQEQQQEQEEEQEKEQQQQQQKEQEQETEEPDVFVKEKYAREDEHPKTWPIAALNSRPSEKQGFWPASDFTVHRSFLEKRGPLQWPDEIFFSSDHTHPRWRFSSHRRLKNLIVLMEWIPDVSALAVMSTANDGVKVPPLIESQKARLQRIVAMYDAEARGALTEAHLRRVMGDLGLQPDADERDSAAIEGKLERLRRSGIDIVLSLEDEYHLLMQSAAQWRWANEMETRKLGALNSRQDGLLNCSEIAAGFAWLGLNAHQEDVHAFVRQIDTDKDGLISLEEWLEAFSGLPESDPSTQPMLAGLILQPRMIRELFEGADDLNLDSRAIPASALANFKFKVKPPKSFSLVWSNKGSTARHKLSIWAADLDTAGYDLRKGLMMKHSLRKVSIGHYAVAGHEPPRSAGRLIEVTDTAAPLGSGSDYLQAVIEQLMPPPLRYRLVWQDKIAGKPVFLWRPVPPSAEFVALGMLATTTEEPPAKGSGSLHCVPRRWCLPQPRASPKLLWKEETASVRAGSVWSSGTPLNTMLVAQTDDVAVVTADSYELENDRWFAQPNKLADLVTFLQPGAAAIAPKLAEPASSIAIEGYEEPFSRVEEGPSGTAPDASTSEMPDEWEAIFDPTFNQTYYYNTRSGESSWERPRLKAESPLQDTELVPASTMSEEDTPSVNVILETPSPAQHLGLTLETRPTQGVYVAELSPDGICARSRLLAVGDVILSVNGMPTDSPTSTLSALKQERIAEAEKEQQRQAAEAEARRMQAEREAQLFAEEEKRRQQAQREAETRKAEAAREAMAAAKLERQRSFATSFSRRPRPSAQDPTPEDNAREAQLRRDEAKRLAEEEAARVAAQLQAEAEEEAKAMGQSELDERRNITTTASTQPADVPQTKTSPSIPTPFSVARAVERTTELRNGQHVNTVADSGLSHDMFLGRRVVLGGLVLKSELNGLYGTAVAFDSESTAAAIWKIIFFEHVIF